MRNIAERSNSKQEMYARMLENFGANLRVCVPGIIQSFDYDSQTATVRVALRENVIDSVGTVSKQEIPLLLDVPVVMPKSGGFAVTLPIVQGDECLIMFSDVCIDAWFTNGGIQNQIERRRHDLSDAFALVGIWSQPNKISSFSENAIEIRNDARDSYISVKDGQIDIVSSIVKINGVTV